MTDSVIGLDASDSTKKVTINKKDRFEQLYIIGSTRQGKSTLIENLVLEDIKNDLGVCLIDPHGDLVNNIISRIAFQVGLLKDPTLEDKDRKKLEHIKRRLENDIVYIDLADKTYVAPFNLFHCEDTTNDHAVENVVSAFLHILQSSFGISPDQHSRMNQYFRHIATLLVYNQNHSMLDILRLLTNDEFMLQLVDNVPDYWEKTFWKDFYAKYSKGMRRMEDISMISNKIEEFISPVMRPWFGDTKKTIHFRKLMDQRKIVLIKSNPEWETITKIVGNVVIAQLLDAAYSRRDIPLNNRKQMNVYVDEYQKFASEDFAKLFSEAAKYGLSMSITQQVLEQVDPAIKAVCYQAKNVAVFSVSPQNGKELASVFDCSPQPGPPRYEPLETPVREPIDYMLKKGVYPQETTENFIKEYGKQLVEKAKQEEMEKQENRRAWDYYERERYHRLDMPSSTVSTDATILLDALNLLFHTAMIAGKRGEDITTISISNYLIDKFINVFNIFEPQRYLCLLETYRIYCSGLKVQVIDLAARESELQALLAPLPLYIEKTGKALREESEKANMQLRRICKEYILAQVSAVRKRFIIVKKSSLFNAVFSNAYAQSSFEKHVDGQNNMLRVRYLKDDTNIATDYKYTVVPLKWNDCHSYVFDTWNEVVVFYLRQYSQVWFDIDERPLFDMGNWIQTVRSVEWKYTRQFYDGNPRAYNRKGYFQKVEETDILNLETWELRDGIEKTWYTYAMLEAELAVRLGNTRWPSEIVETLQNYLGWTPIEEEYKKAVLQVFDPDERTISETIKERKEIERIEYELERLNEIKSVKTAYDEFVGQFTSEMQEIMRELSNAPVEADCGLTKEVPTEILTPEVEARIANQLKQLPKHTARVKLVSGEYTITTIKPEGHIGNTALEKRIAEIQERNRKDGYLRLRSEVKKEIEQRYQLPAPQQPTLQVGLKNNPPVQKPQQVAVPVVAQAAPIPRKRAIATPAGKQCPDCGVQNSPTAHFCQGCGKKL